MPYKASRFNEKLLKHPVIVFAVPAGMPELHPVAKAIIYVLLKKPMRFTEIYEAVRKLIKKDISRPALAHHLRQLVKKGVVARRMVSFGHNEKAYRYYLTPIRTTVNFTASNGQKYEVAVIWYQKETPFILVELRGDLGKLSKEEWKSLLEECRSALIAHINRLLEEEDKKRILNEYFLDLMREIRGA